MVFIIKTGKKGKHSIALSLPHPHPNTKHSPSESLFTCYMTSCPILSSVSFFMINKNKGRELWGYFLECRTRQSQGKKPYVCLLTSLFLFTFMPSANNIDVVESFYPSLFCHVHQKRTPKLHSIGNHGSILKERPPSLFSRRYGAPGSGVSVVDIQRSAHGCVYRECMCTGQMWNRRKRSRKGLGGAETRSLVMLISVSSVQLTPHISSRVSSTSLALQPAEVWLG